MASSIDLPRSMRRCSVTGQEGAVAITSLQWLGFGERDIHLLPDTVSPRIDRLFEIRNADDTTQRADNPPAGVTVTFEPRFAGTATGNQFVGHGVTVDTATGQVTVGSLPGGPKLRNFIIICKVQEAINSLETRIRIHVHESISRVWLTPNPLTAREGATGVRLSVLAKFADGTIGDITNWGAFSAQALADQIFVRGTGLATPALAWRPDPASPLLAVNPDMTWFRTKSRFRFSSRRL
jgi:hypothetical protein